MTRLRDQLRQARAEHRSAEYPGDLADELLPRRAGGGPRWFWSMAVGGAAAAAAVFAVVHQGALPGASPAGKPNPHVAALVAPERASTTTTTVLYTLPARLPLTIPVAPLMPASPPVLVSLDGFPANLGPLQQSYEELPKFLRQFNPHGSAPPAEGPLPEKGSALPTPTTQQSA